MGSITEIKKPDKTTGKPITTYRAFIRRKGYAQKSKVFDSRAKAKTWLRNNEGDSSLVRVSKGHGQTFKDVVELFINAPPMRGTKFWAPSQIDFWIELFGQMKIGAISRGDINTAINTLQSKPAMHRTPGGTNPTGEVLTPATVNRYLASLSSVFNFALAREIIDVHPMKSGNVRKLKEPTGRRRILTAEEEKRLLDAAGESSWPMMRLFVRMLMTTAARKSEVLNLRWQDIHFDDSIALLPTSKNDEPRALPMVADVKAALEEKQKIRPNDSDYVFFDPRHHDRPKRVDTIWKFVRQRAGLLNDRDDRLDQVVMHTTRHTGVTRMIKSGANVVQVAAVSGHKTLSMLKKYSHLDSKDSVTLAQKVLGGGSR